MVLFLRLDLFPETDDFFRVIDFLIGKHMRVPVFHLCCDIMHDIRKSELAALLRHHGVQDNVHENVAELLAHVGVILCRDGVQKLAALLHNERHQRFMRLLAVPRTPVRRTQSFHDADQFLNIGT